jgi:hypothetical protein
MTNKEQEQHRDYQALMGLKPQETYGTKDTDGIDAKLKPKLEGDGLEQVIGTPNPNAKETSEYGALAMLMYHAVTGKKPDGDKANQLKAFGQAYELAEKLEDYGAQKTIQVAYAAELMKDAPDSTYHLIGQMYEMGKSSSGRNQDFNKRAYEDILRGFLDSKGKPTYAQQ